MIKIFFLLLATLFLNIPIAYAGDGHGHNHESAIEPAPHGGILRDSPPYKTELVLNKDHAKIYIYDSSLTQLSNNKLAPTAKGELGFPKDRVKKEVIFNLVDGIYQGEMPGISNVHRFDLHVSITVEGKEIIGDFGIDNIH